MAGPFFLFSEALSSKTGRLPFIDVYENVNR